MAPHMPQEIGKKKIPDSEEDGFLQHPCKKATGGVA
jgi:hypothetical protein